MELGPQDAIPIMVHSEGTMTIKPRRFSFHDRFAKLRKVLETGVMDSTWLKSEKNTLRGMAKMYCLKDDAIHLISRGKLRRVVESKEEQMQLIKHCHEDAEKDHNGITITYDKLRASYFWDNMRPDIETYIAACECRAVRAQKRTQVRLFNLSDLQELEESTPIRKKRKPSMQSCQTILVIQTGGTIDKDYPRREGGYLFEIDEPAAQRVLCRIQPSFTFTVLSVCRKDSQDITDDDRADMANVINENAAKKVLVTHGTDTMIETANFLAESCPDKTIVLTGAFLPEQFKNSDAEFNLGFALGALHCLQRPGVHVAMNGRVLAHDWVTRDPETKNFVQLTS